MIRVALIYIFLIGALVNITGQEFLPRIVNYSPKQYGDLLTPENWSIAQDDKGVMYFGNTNCVLIYDGINWETITIEALSSVTALAEHNGVIYCGGSNEFGFLAPNKIGKLIYHSLSDSLNLDFSSIWRIHTIEDNIYFQSEEGIFEYNGKEVSAILPESSFHLSFSIDDKLFVRQRGIGIMELKDGELSVAIPGDSLYGVFDILQGEKENEYLLVTQEFGLWSYDPSKNGKIYPVSEDSCAEIRYRNIIGGTTIFEGVHALYSTTDGLLIVNNKGELQDVITRESGLKSDEIKSVYVDKHENLWLASGGGISLLNDNSPISYYQEPNGIIGNVQAITEFKGVKYIGTSLGLFRESIASDLHFEETFIQDQTWDFEEVNNKTLFIGTGSGLYKLTEGNNLDLLSTDNCNALYFDKEQNFLIAAGSSGVTIYDGYSNWDVLRYFPLGVGRVTGIEKHPKTGEYWIGTQTVGAVRFIFDGFDFSYDVFGENDGLHHGELVVPFVDKDEVYFGSPYDLLVFVHEEEVKKSLSEEDKENPDYYRGYFSEAKIFDIEAGHIYQQMLFAGDLTFGCIDNKLTLFAEGERHDKNFKSVDIGRINLLKLIGQNLYVGAAEGLLVVDVPKLIWKINNAQPNTFSTVIRKVNYKDSALFHGFGISEKLPQVDYRKNHIEFDYSASFYEGTHKPMFSWKLEGSSEVWSKWSNNTRAEFSNLHEGTYDFLVKSKNIFEEESEIASFKFEILTPWFRTVWAYVGYVVLLILIVYVAIVLGRKRLKAKNIWLEGVVEERTVEIKEKNKELEHSYHEIAEQQQEITDSINYAKRIQEAILPLSADIGQHLPEYFVLFMPKDIVSGDFYWFHQINNESVFVCADCTGHGVPGAFMSMIGSDKLNRAVIEERTTDPSKILSHLNRGIKKALKQNEDDEEATRDGMDAAIVSVDMKQMKLKFAGAHRPLFLVRDGELSETKATKVAVGGFTPDDQQFELNNMEIKEGDCYYMTSDGYPDQFGGDRGKKFKMKAFKDLLVKVSSESMEEQKNILKTTILDWMGDEYEQIDDICIVGIKIK